MGREQSTGKPTNGEIWEKRELPKKKFEGSRKTRKDKGRPRKTKKDKEGDSAYIFLQIKESYCPFLSAKYNNELPNICKA